MSHVAKKCHHIIFAAAVAPCAHARTHARKMGKNNKPKPSRVPGGGGRGGGGGGGGVSDGAAALAADAVREDAADEEDEEEDEDELAPLGRRTRNPALQARMHTRARARSAPPAATRTP
jgi:hypothetical protein